MFLLYIPILLLSAVWISFQLKLLWRKEPRTKYKSIGSTFEWAKCDPLRLYPFVGKKNFNPSMGVRNLSSEPECLFLIENTYLDCVNLRKKNMVDFEEKLVHCNENSRSVDAVREFYDMTVDFMCQRYPQYFKANLAGGYIDNTITGSRLPLYSANENPRSLLKFLAFNIEEDFLIMLKDDPGDEDEEYVLRASLTGLPAGFDPSHNFDKPISHIHGPVPQYSGRLRAPMHRFFNKIQSKDIWQRANWSLQTNNEFFKLENHHAREGDTIIELRSDQIDFEKGCYLRCERQILTRLPKSHAVIMLVRTYLSPISKVKADGVAHDLATAIESLPDDLAFYKRAGVWGKAVVSYLRN
ncbi:hypothetical protein PUMCH_003235 [Australozyma saopauloensis]|uniref:Uncharacterized protein n=1 Tax=Australozyma saopauloensis TaxID=291208 RepID=A0AAX4HBV8_9ASCO|nr:hypothetical protein PUMCH_003235 [[Candida] saopauloensis]